MRGKWRGNGRGWAAVLVGLLVLGSLAVPCPAQGQEMAGWGMSAAHAYFAAPGNYGTSWGTASYGTVRTYSEFSSPYGGGYGYGYAPWTYLPGRYGLGIWQPGATTSPYVLGGPNVYRTWAAPYSRAGNPSLPPPPPFGLYAPAFGPTFPGW